jgi:hypothetical protein
MILKALSEIPSFSKFVLTIDMQLDLTDCEEDVFFPDDKAIRFTRP